MGLEFRMTSSMPETPARSFSYAEQEYQFLRAYLISSNSLMTLPDVWPFNQTRKPVA
jgi:hypothetical protein